MSGISGRGLDGCREVGWIGGSMEEWVERVGRVGGKDEWGGGRACGVVDVMDGVEKAGMWVVGLER